MRLHTDTPLKRLGIIFFAMPALIALIAAIHWNIERKTFYYKISELEYAAVVKPQDDANNLWIRLDADHAWYKLRRKCHENAMAENKKQNSNDWEFILGLYQITHLCVTEQHAEESIK